AGTVRIFLRPDMRYAEKIAVNFTFSQKKYDFIMCMKSGTCTEIQFAPPSGSPPAESAGLCAAMQARLGVPVVQAAGAADAFPAEPDAIVTAGGFA
ncbi:MAG: hypothetical protein K2H09_01430, partial [Treponemataceae bacterium]|nr:hypothetical protein [Treponemataceae bacterium]